MWQAVAAIGALLLSIPATVIGVIGFYRSARAEDAKGRADAAEVGLQYLREGLAAQQATITRQQGEIGELRGQLKVCHEERHVMAGEIEKLRDEVRRLA